MVPYFGYARQDRRNRAGESLGSRVVADAIAGAGADRLIVVDPHTKSLEAMCPIPVEVLTAVPELAAAGKRGLGEVVVVAPDLGAVKLAEHCAAPLRAPVAVVRKTRQTGSTVRAEELVGDVESKPVLIVDDMISTGGTIEAAAHVLLEHGALSGITVVAAHGLLVDPAADRLAALPLRSLFVTDSLAQRASAAFPLEVHSIAPLLADAIGRLHQNLSVDDLLARS